MKTADMSTFNIDSQQRIWCNKPGCKKQTHVMKWICVKCSNEANSRKPSGKDLHIEFSKCVCYAKILARQGQVVMRCPQVTCPGWNAYERLPVSREARITCNVCAIRTPVVQWHCFSCNMTKDKCICNALSHVESNSVRKRPAQRGLPKPNTKRSRR